MLAHLKIVFIIFSLSITPVHKTVIRAMRKMKYFVARRQFQQIRFVSHHFSSKSKPTWCPKYWTRPSVPKIVIARLETWVRSASAVSVFCLCSWSSLSDLWMCSLIMLYCYFGATLMTLYRAEWKSGSCRIVALAHHYNCSTPKSRELLAELTN